MMLAASITMMSSCGNDDNKDNDNESINLDKLTGTYSTKIVVHPAESEAQTIVDTTINMAVSKDGSDLKVSASFPLYGMPVNINDFKLTSLKDSTRKSENGSDNDLKGYIFKVEEQPITLQVSTTSIPIPIKFAGAHNDDGALDNSGVYERYDSGSSSSKGSGINFSLTNTDTIKLNPATPFIPHSLIISIKGHK